MKYMILLIAANFALQVGYSQNSDSIKIRDINKALVRGLYCCQQVDGMDSIINYQNEVIQVQERQISAWEYRYNQKHGSFKYADSMYQATYKQLLYSDSEVSRLKKGKRNWIYVSLGLVASGVGYYLLTK